MPAGQLPRWGTTNPRKNLWTDNVTRRAFIRLALAACAIVLGAQAGAATAKDEPAFFVGSHGWHTSIIVPRAEIPRGAFPRGITERTFGRYAYLEIGWGDRKFYTAPHPNAVMAIDAAILPGPSVLHIVGLNAPVATALAWSAIVMVPCTPPEFDQLCRALGASFERDADGRITALGAGLYGEISRFYPARSRYYLFNTCDTWTVQMMRAGGLKVHADLGGTYSAGAVIAQARRAIAARAARKGSG